MRMHDGCYEFRLIVCVGGGWVAQYIYRDDNGKANSQYISHVGKERRYSKNTQNRLKLLLDNWLLNRFFSNYIFKVA